MLTKVTLMIFNGRGDYNSKKLGCIFCARNRMWKGTPMNADFTIIKLSAYMRSWHKVREKNTGWVGRSEQREVPARGTYLLNCPAAKLASAGNLESVFPWQFLVPYSVAQS